MIVTDTQSSLWTTLRDPEPRLFLRIGVSIALGIFLAGLALLGGGVVGIAFRNGIRPDKAASLFLLAACFIWLIGLWRIWGVIRGVRPVAHSAVATIVISLLVIAGMVACDEYIHRGSEEMMAGWFFCGLATILFVWVSAFHRLYQRFPVLDRENQVRVHCPSCGYSLIGLTELRCPECGTRFTIDDLIRAQRYAGAGRAIDKPVGLPRSDRSLDLESLTVVPS